MKHPPLTPTNASGGLVSLLAQLRLPWNSLGLLAVLLLLIALFSSQSAYFFSTATARSLANQIPTLTVIAVGMTYVLLIGGIDLSVGSVMALSAAVVGTLMAGSDWPLVLALCAGLGTGLLCGLASGYISAHWRVPAFVVTLGMLEIARGGAYRVTASQTRYVGASAGLIGDPLPGLGVSPALLLALAVVALAQFVLVRTVFGRYMIAIGTNEEAVRLSGINPLPWKVAVFALAGLLAALGGVFQLGYLQSADPNAGIGLELSAIAAVVIGGTSLSGGRGSVVNSFLGVLIIAVMETGLAQLGVSEPGKRIITGTLIILAVLLDQYREPLGRWLSRRRASAQQR
jgi:ribose transport system permease protein